MNKTIKILTITFLALGIVVIIAVFAANSILKGKIENFIKQGLPENISSSYGEVSVNSLDGTLLVTKPVIVIQNKENGVKHTFIKAEKLVVSGMSYWNYFVNKEIHIGKITFDTPSFEFHKDKAIAARDTIERKIQLEKPIFIENIRVQNSNLAIYESGEDSTKLYTQNLSLEINNLVLNQEVINKKIPFEYKTIQAKGDSLFLKANPFDNLSVKEFSVENKNILFEGIEYRTKYSKTELSRQIKVERDHYDLSVASLSVYNFNYGFRDSLFYAEIEKVLLNSPRAEIYRDKLVADDPSIKPLYSKSLRELSFDLTVDSVKIKDGNLKYEERVQKENLGGFIQFHDLNARISNVGNTYKKPEKTNIKIDAIFMDRTPFTANWEFDVQDKDDRFVFSANVGPLEAERMNRFTEPNLRVRLQGQASKTYFTIDGNNESSTTDLKINYSDLKVEVLRKDGKNKNKFLSAVANIFVSKDTERKEEKFKEAEGEATRNKTKSVFNLLWISVQSALQKIMI